MSTFGDRLRESRLRAGISQGEAARKAGVKQPTLSKLENGGSTGSKITTTLARIYQVNPHWLATGQGAPELGVDVIPSVIGKTEIPVLNYVQAGEFKNIGYGLDTTNNKTIMTDLELSGAAFALEIRGESMTPEFNEGDRIIVDCGLKPRPGDYVVATKNGDEATFKKYRLISTNPDVYELISLNPDYPNFRSDKEPCQIIGVMVEHRRYRK